MQRIKIRKTLNLHFTTPSWASRARASAGGASTGPATAGASSTGTVSWNSGMPKLLFQPSPAAKAELTRPFPGDAQCPRNLVQNLAVHPRLDRDPVAFVQAAQGGPHTLAVLTLHGGL